MLYNIGYIILIQFDKLHFFIERTFLLLDKKPNLSFPRKQVVMKNGLFQDVYLGIRFGAKYVLRKRSLSDYSVDVNESLRKKLRNVTSQARTAKPNGKNKC